MLRRCTWLSKPRQRSTTVFRLATPHGMESVFGVVFCTCVISCHPRVEVILSYALFKTFFVHQESMPRRRVRPPHDRWSDTPHTTLSYLGAFHQELMSNASGARNPLPMRRERCRCRCGFPHACGDIASIRLQRPTIFASFTRNTNFFVNFLGAYSTTTYLAVPDYLRPVHVRPDQPSFSVPRLLHQGSQRM